MHPETASEAMQPCSFPQFTSASFRGRSVDDVTSACSAMPVIGSSRDTRATPVATPTSLSACAIGFSNNSTCTNTFNINNTCTSTFNINNTCTNTFNINNTCTSTFSVSSGLAQVLHERDASSQQYLQVRQRGGSDGPARLGHLVTTCVTAAGSAYELTSSCSNISSHGNMTALSSSYLSLVQKVWHLGVDGMMGVARRSGLTEPTPAHPAAPTGTVRTHSTANSMPRSSGQVYAGLNNILTMTTNVGGLPSARVRKVMSRVNSALAKRDEKH